MSWQTIKSTMTRPLSGSELKLLGLAASAPLAVWAGFIGPSVRQAEYVVRNHAYAVMLLAFGLFVVALYRIRRAWRGAGAPVGRREGWLAVGLILACSWLFVSSEPMRAKVLNDEFVLQSTAYNLHFFRDAGSMVRGYDVAGVFLPLGDYLDKRPILYPFLVALVHDLTGFRISNAFAVNALLVTVLLGLSWWLARRLAGRGAGFLAVALLGTLPLLGQSATGSGMELANVTMITLAAVLGLLYLEQPDEDRGSALALALVLLCQARYESATIAAAGALVVLGGWMRTRRVILSWPMILAPLLLVPFALQHKVLANTPVLWELTDERSARFSLDYLPENLQRAWRFFSSQDLNSASSWYLSLAGGMGCGWLAVQVWRHRRLKLAQWPVANQALAPIGAAILVNFALVMNYYWAGLDDPMASRFALPLYVLLAILAAVACAQIDARGRAVRIALVGALVFVCGVTRPRLARHGYSNLGINEQEWMVRAVAARAKEPRIVIANRSTMIWLLHRTPSILINRAKLYQDRLRFQLKAGYFKEILLTQELRPASAQGQHRIIPDDMMPASFHLETVAEKRFGTKLMRISRIVAIDPCTPKT